MLISDADVLFTTLYVGDELFNLVGENTAFSIPGPAYRYDNLNTVHVKYNEQLDLFVVAANVSIFFGQIEESTQLYHWDLYEFLKSSTDKKFRDYFNDFQYPIGNP